MFGKKLGVEIKEMVTISELTDTQMERLNQLSGVRGGDSWSKLKDGMMMTTPHVEKVASLVGLARRIEEDKRNYDDARVFAELQDRLYLQASNMRETQKSADNFRRVEDEQDIGAFQRRMAKYSVFAAACSALAAVGSLAVAIIQLTHTSK